MPSLSVIEDFLAQPRLALVGVSPVPQEFANTIVHELRAHGHTVYPVNRHLDIFEGGPCFASVGDIPEPVDGVVVMVSAAAALDVVRECDRAGIRRVWLHKGIGGPGAVSAEAVAYCREHDIAVVDGACPLMFLQPVAWFHRSHRAVRRARHTLTA